MTITIVAGTPAPATASKGGAPAATVAPFMLGKALCADMLDEACRIGDEANGEAYLQFRFRDNVIALPTAASEPPPRPPENRRGSYPRGVVPRWKLQQKRYLRDANARDAKAHGAVQAATPPSRPALLARRPGDTRPDWVREASRQLAYIAVEINGEQCDGVIVITTSGDHCHVYRAGACGEPKQE